MVHAPAMPIGPAANHFMHNFVAKGEREKRQKHQNGADPVEREIEDKTAQDVDQQCHNSTCIKALKYPPPCWRAVCYIRGTDCASLALTARHRE